MKFTLYFKYVHGACFLLQYSYIFFPIKNIQDYMQNLYYHQQQLLYINTFVLCRSAWVALNEFVLNLLVNQ